MLAAALYWLWSGTRRPHVEIDPARYPVTGIDISQHNGDDIDYDKVRASGITFVYIKASEGTRGRDKNFLTNARKARQAGLVTGAYHYFRKGADGRLQARNFLQAVSHTRLDLPLVVDVEDWLNDPKVSNHATATGVRAMLDYLLMHGRRVMLYTNREGYKKWVKPYFASIDLWLCAFNPPQDLEQERHVMQQYSHWGTVDGIDSDVDLDVFNGSHAEWQRWLEAGS